MKRSWIAALCGISVFGLTAVSYPASPGELFGVHVMVVPQSDSPVRIRQINIGEGEDDGSPEVVLENLTDRTVHSIAFSIWMAQPKNCYDESVTPREPQRYHAVFFSRPLLPHSETTVVYSGRPSFLRPDLPLLDLTRHAPTPTVGYVHVQVAIETVGIEGKTWRRKQVRDGKPLPPYDPDLYEIDRPDCSAWQAVVPRLRSMGGADISLKEPHVLERAGAGIPQSSESAYFFTCAYVQKADGSAFICPNLSAPPRGHSGKR